MAYLTSLSRLLAVPLLVIGFFTQWIALLMAIEMLAAVWAKYLDTHSVFDGIDLPLSVLGICLILLVLGPGMYSIDALF